ncbi:MAG TPA: hypothetical protein VFI68_14065 [Anaerolineales bacterium]|nr:hypothetical protein [Anaerolineales bacterium]
MGVLLLSTIVTPNDAAAQPSFQPGLVLPDGQWTATAVTAGPITGAGFAGAIIYDGAFSFIVTDGVVAGDWNILGTSNFSGGCFSGNGAYVIEGIIDGTAAGPVLRQTGGYGNSTVSLCDGTEQSGPISMSGALTAPITLTSVSCEQAVGHFKLPADMAVASGGASSDLVAPFIATRAEAVLSHDMEIYSGEVTALTLEGLDLTNSVEGGELLDFVALNEILGRAEELYRQLRLINDCDRRNAGEFINSLQSTIAGLIDTALAHPDQFSSHDIARLISAALRVGLIGDGAADPDLASQYERELINELERRLDEGLDDCVDAAGLVVGADLLGVDGLLEAIQTDLDALCL